MTTRTETENIKTSGAEKLLAAILTVFILIGAVWAYGQIGKISEDRYSDEYGGTPGWVVNDELSATHREALRDASRARRDLWKSDRAVNARRNQVEFAREAYRTEIDAGRAAPAELAEYRNAQAALEDAEAQRRKAKASLDEAAPAAAAANRQKQELRNDREARRESDDRIVFGLRLLLLAAMLAGGYWAMSAVRRRRSRLLPLALAEISAAALLAAYFAIDYGSSLIVFRELGPLVISLVGIAVTIAAFVALQRYLAKRIPIRRVRRRECPFCGYPVHGTSHCEGCGRKVVGECTTCRKARRVATPHCGNCGAA
jgi:hypothetical protein